MSKGVLLSVAGLYHMDNTIFDSMQLPAGLDRNTVVDGIIQDCMELEILYPNPEALKVMIGIWSRRELPTWNRIYNAEQAEYNPIENYDRQQKDTRKTADSGADTSASTASSETDTTGSLNRALLHKYAAFDSGTLADQTSDTETSSSTGGEETSQTVNNTLTHGKKTDETFESRIHGNIGVTTSQQMLESELTLAPKINTINYVVNSFKMRFCILVY